MYNYIPVIKEKLQDYWAFMISALFIIVSNGEVSILKTFLLLLVQLFLILIPGEVFLRFTKILFKNAAIAHLCSYAVGYIMSILLYIIVLIINIQNYCLSVYLIYGVIMLFLFNKYKAITIYKKHISKLDNIILLFCLTTSLIIGVVIYLLPNKSPEVVGYQNQIGDLTYWFKNCVAATKRYPLPELSVKDLNLYWHLFSCFQIAFLHFITGIEIYNLCFTFAYVWKILLLVGSVYVVSTSLLKKRSSVLIVMLTTLFTSGLDKQTFVYYQFHLYRCSLAFEEGYAMSMFGFVFFLKFIEMKKKNIFAYMLTVLGIAGALGLKVSGGTVLFAGMAVRLLLSLEKKWKKFFEAGILLMSYCLVYFIISKFFIIDGNALTSSTSSHRMVFSPFNTLMRPGGGYYGVIYKTLKTGFLNKYIAYAITVLIYFIQWDYAISIPLTISIILILLTGKWRCFFSKNTLSLISIILCGQGIFIFFDHPGFSQVYFVFNTFSFAAILAMILLENCEYGFSYARPIVMGTALVLIILSCHFNFVNYTDIYLIPSHMFDTEISAQSRGENDISFLEMKGLRWIRENSPENIVLATNKVLFGNPEQSFFSRTFITSEYSERQVYLEGFSSTNLPNMEFVMERLSQLRNYYNGIPGSASILQQNGVTHAVLFKGDQNASVTIEGGVIYENEDIAILDLKIN